MGGKQATTTQSVAIPREVLERYSSVNKLAEQVAQQPFQQYGGEFVAPLTGTQQAGIGATYQAAGAAQPYYGAAAGLTAAGAGPVMPGELETQRYMNPFTQNVVESTQRALQQQQGQQLSQQKAEAIRGGAYGGDRSGIQRAVLQGQQGLATSQALSPLYQQNYMQALQTAQQQQGVGLQAQQANMQRALAAGQQFGALGTGAQQAGLAGAQALLGAGTLEQQTQQAGDTAKYQQFLQERGYPFQVAQFLANIAMGTGALSGSTTTTTQPAPFFSDEREKTNIKPLGKGLYAYDYKDDVEAARREGKPMPPKRVGPMAQDIEKKKPGLVIDINDYKVVDPSRDSMGGAVMEPGAYDRGGYAPGGLVGAEDLRSILAAQQQFLGPYGGQGGPYGGQKQGQPGFVPQASLPVARLVTAGAVPQQRPSEFQQIMQGAQQAQGLGEALIGEKGLFGEKGLAGKAIKSLGLGSAPPAAAPPPAQVPETGQPETTARKEDTVKNARGGLIPHHYADGGMPYGGDPTLADVLQEGKNEIRQLPKPGEPPKQQSGLGQVADMAKGVSSLYGLGQTAASAGSTLMDFLPAVLALKQGGLVPRHAYADGGDTGMPSDDELAIRTMLSEVGRGRRGEVNPQEALGVGAVIANRARSRGLSPGDVVLQSGQFEPWARAGGPNDPMKWDPSSQAYQEMASYWQRAKAGEDPTGGASHFYGPASQSALGRAAPSWASSPGVQLGATSFHRVENVPQNGLIPTSAPRESDFPAQDASEAQLVRQQDEGGLGAAARAILPTTKSPTGEESINWKQILIPALSGLGAMASSPSRYLGSAILQGIGKGAESYANLEKLQADIGQTQAQTERLGESSAEIRQLMAKGDIFVTPNGQQMVLLPGGVQISYGEWLKRGKPPTLSTSRFGPYTPPGAQPSTGTQGAPGAETVSPPALPKPLVSLADANAEKALREGPKILGQDPTNNPFTVTTQRADAARNDMPQTLQYARVLADLPANYSGPIPAQIITPLIQKVNSLLGAVGAPQIPQTGEPIAAKEVIDKIAVGLARARQAGTGGAVAEFEALLKAVPTDWNSKLGQSQLVSSMLAEQRMALEEDKAYNAYRDYIEKKYGLQGNESQFAGRGLRQAFSEQYQSQFQQDKKILQHMFLNEFKDKEGKPALVMKDVNGEMKPVSVLSYLIQNAGSPGNDRIRKALEAQYGANNVQRILGYFGRQ